MLEQKQMVPRGWVVTFAGTAINIIIGAVYAWSVFGKEMVVQWKWTATDAVLPFAAGVLFITIGMLFGGRMQDLIGPRVVVLIGALSLGIGWCLCSLSRDPTFVFLAFSILCGTGIGFCLTVNVASALKWFPSSKRGLIAGIVTSGISLSAHGGLLQF